VTAGLTVAVVAGGPSSEASVSRASAAGVERALGQAGHAPRVLELTPALGAELRAAPPDVVFPAVHGAVGEDGCLQGLLEILGLPYVGSGVLASALAMSKPHAKVHFRAAGLPVAGDLSVRRGDDLPTVARRLLAEVGPRLVVKPGAGGSAIGVAVLTEGVTEAALVLALERALGLDETVLVERFVAGKEVTCAVLEDERGEPRALPPTLILPQAGAFYDFKSKYGTKGSVHQCPAPFPAVLIATIQAQAVAAHLALGCRDLSRVDFVVDDDAAGGDGAGQTTLLEVNTLPGMTATSLFPEAAQAAGIPFQALCDRLVRKAHARPRARAPEAVAMPG
jgi:D-alanine-D-alanine ligase